MIHMMNTHFDIILFVLLYLIIYISITFPLTLKLFVIVLASKFGTSLSLQNYLHDDLFARFRFNFFKKHMLICGICVFQGHSGLLGCLPQPKFSSISTKSTGSKPNERKPSKLYVPYTLNKKKNETAKTDVKLAEKENESDSDDEGSSNSFFSFGENMDKSKEGLISSNESPISSRSAEDVDCKTDKVPIQIVSAPAVKNSEGTTSHKNDTSPRLSSIDNPPKERKAEEDFSTALTGPYKSASTSTYDAYQSGLYGQSAEASSQPVADSYTTYNDNYSASYSGNHAGVYNGGTTATYSSAQYQDAYGSYWGSGNYYQGHMATQHGHYGQRSYLNPEPDSQHNQFPVSAMSFLLSALYRVANKPCKPWKTLKNPGFSLPLEKCPGKP